MKRVVLFHWNADEARERAQLLERAGHEVEAHAVPDLARLRGLGDAPPDAFVIDLGRIPSQGRDLATWIRRQKGTRTVPIVFVGGAPEKVARVRKLLPDAQYATWDGVGRVLETAVDRAPESPVVPGAMAGYSGTPLPKKLGIREGGVVALSGAPEAFEATLGSLPPGTRIRRQARGPADVVVLFVKSRAELVRRFPAAAKALAEGGKLWLAWPKKASGIDSDVTQATVRAFGLERDFVDYKIAAIDETWSGLCFARRDPS